MSDEPVTLGEIARQIGAQRAEFHEDLTRLEAALSNRVHVETYSAEMARIMDRLEASEQRFLDRLTDLDRRSQRAMTTSTWVLGMFLVTVVAVIVAFLVETAGGGAS